MDTDHPDLVSFRRQWNDELGRSRFTSGQIALRDREISEASTSTLLPQSVPRDLREPSESYSQQTTSNSPSDDGTQNGRSQTEMHWETEPDETTTLIVATDFGTTFSSVAFAKCEQGRRPRVKIIQNYPDDPRTQLGGASFEVPSESWYPDAPVDGNSFVNVVAEDDELRDPFSDESDVGGDIPDVDNDMDIDPLPADNNTPALLWGYGIQNLTAPDLDQSQFSPVSRSKLLLDSSDNTQTVRDELRPILHRLKLRGTIKEDEDVIADFLTKLFQHAKKQLADVHDIAPSIPIEHVICVPIIWEANSIRKMQKATEIAIRKSGFGTIDNLFFVSEPEAAATYVLGLTDEVVPGETFLILDAGGGTVDATTYTVDRQNPLRLKKEVVESDGCLHGSSYLNEDFRTHLLRRLEGETYLERSGFTIQGIVNAEVIKFENRMKRNLDVTDPQMPPSKIIIQGLREDESKRFGTNRLFLDRQHFREIFMPHLRAIADLMRDQLRLASDAGLQVNKVVLIGGFSASKSLQKYLARELKQISISLGYRIRLISKVDSTVPETAVAHGAVLRAIDKEFGPKRFTHLSYGCLKMEPYDDSYEGHIKSQARIDKLDGIPYMRNMIEWLVRKGEKIDYRAEYLIPVHHTFPVSAKFFRCEEVLYVSETKPESHYHRKHENNRGAEVAGKIIADMTFLKTQNIIQPIEGHAKRRHYKVEFDLVLIIEGRNLRFEARWPAGGQGQVQISKRISIAAAFVPGTK